MNVKMNEHESEIDKKLNAILGITYETNESPNDSSNEVITLENNEIEIIEPEITDLVPVENDNTFDQSDADFELARNNIKELTNIGMQNIKRLSELAIDSQTPRMFEVLSDMIKNINDVNTNLIDIHNKKISSTPAEETSNQTINVNQAVICTSTDALKRIKERKRNN